MMELELMVADSAWRPSAWQMLIVVWHLGGEAWDEAWM